MSGLYELYEAVKKEKDELHEQLEAEFRRIIQVIRYYFGPLDRAHKGYSFDRPSTKFIGNTYLDDLTYIGVEDSFDGNEKVIVGSDADGDTARFPYIYMTMGDEEIIADLQARLDLAKAEKEAKAEKLKEQRRARTKAKKIEIEAKERAELARLQEKYGKAD